MSLVAKLVRQVRTLTYWFDPEDGLEVTVKFLVCLPFGFLVTPPLFAAQLPTGFLLFTVLGWVGLPALTWATAQSAHRRSGRKNRQSFGSLLLWLGIGYSWVPVFLLVVHEFWLKQDYGWAAGLLAISLFMVWQCLARWRAYQEREDCSLIRG
jgi:hypothetical protein